MPRSHALAHAARQRGTWLIFDVRQTVKMRRLRFAAAAIGTMFVVSLAWRFSPSAFSSGWTLFSLSLAYGVLAAVLNFSLALAKLKKATSAELAIRGGPEQIRDRDDRPNWMVVVMDIAAAVYSGAVCATLIEIATK